MFKIKLPATSANICCGLDTFGMAVTLYNTFGFERAGSFLFNGKEEDENNPKNLVLRSYFFACEYLGIIPEKISITGHFDVPAARGLGSSATCVVAGVIAAFKISGREVDLKDVFNISATIEGHPDNVAPCIYGGMGISYSDNTGFKTYKIYPDSKYKICAFIPDFKLLTRKSRGVLPANYTREDAVFNIQRAALLPLSLERGNTDFVKDALHDRLHEKYRKELIPGYDDIISITEDFGFVGTYLSGAGPTVMGIYEDSISFKYLRERLRDLEYRYNVQSLRIDNRGVVF